MTTEDKALAMVREEDGEGYLNYDAAIAALCRAIEQHEAFRQEVSDVVELSIDRSGHDGLRAGHINEYLGRFIIPAPKPDPLVEVIEAWFSDFRQEVSDAASFRTALEAYGLEIRAKNNG